MAGHSAVTPQRLILELSLNIVIFLNLHGTQDFNKSKLREYKGNYLIVLRTLYHLMTLMVWNTYEYKLLIIANREVYIFFLLFHAYHLIYRLANNTDSQPKGCSSYVLKILIN